MVFNPNIPNAGDFLSVSQVNLLNNFNSISAQFEINHVPLFDGMEDDRGKHEKITFVEQSGDPTTTGNTFALYTKNLSGQPELYGREESDGTIYRFTKNGELEPVLRLEAFVIFDRSGNIIENAEGTPFSYNIANITKPNANRDDWIINFTNNISTDKFFWILTNANRPIGDFAWNTFTPFMTNVYANAITNAMIRVQGKNANGLSTPSQNQINIACVQVYTVA